MQCKMPLLVSEQILGNCGLHIIRHVPHSVAFFDLRLLMDCVNSWPSLLASGYRILHGDSDTEPATFDGLSSVRNLILTRVFGWR